MSRRKEGDKGGGTERDETGTRGVKGRWQRRIEYWEKDGRNKTKEKRRKGWLVNSCFLSIWQEKIMVFAILSVLIFITRKLHLYSVMHSFYEAWVVFFYVHNAGKAERALLHCLTWSRRRGALHQLIKEKDIHREREKKARLTRAKFLSNIFLPSSSALTAITTLPPSSTLLPTSTTTTFYILHYRTAVLVDVNYKH